MLARLAALKKRGYGRSRALGVMNDHYPGISTNTARIYYRRLKGPDYREDWVRETAARSSERYSELSRERAAALTPEKKRKKAKRTSRTLKTQRAGVPKKVRSGWVKKGWDSLTSEQRKSRTKSISEAQRARANSLTPEQREVLSKAQKLRWAKFRASLLAEMDSRGVYPTDERDLWERNYGEEILVDTMAVRKTTAQEWREAIAEAVKTLPVKQREIVRLRFGLDSGKEMSSSEIAEAHGSPEDHVKKQLTNAIKKLAAREDLRSLVGLTA